VVDTRGSHADLTPDYAAIPTEMKEIAGFFGRSVLRELDAAAVLGRTAELRTALGDRGILRALHFFNENKRVEAMGEALAGIEHAGTPEQQQAAMDRYLDLANSSGASSWELLQNVYSPQNPREQGVSLALALTREFLSAEGEDTRRGACRVHGGGFAGTIQAYIAFPALDRYRGLMEAVFGEGSLTVLRIRPVGAVELFQ
jgi:galactokinase